MAEVDVIAAEDTRRTRKLLAHYDISTPCVSFHQHSGQERLDRLIATARTGKTIALVSDAGTPGISDPGQGLVAACVDNGIDVVPLPGACAAVTALSASGYPLASFTYHGFLPRKGLDSAVAALASCEHPIVLYESPRRIVKLLESIERHMSKRELVLARELTKFYQQILRGKPAELLALVRAEDLERGEFTLVLGPWKPASKQWMTAEILARVQEYTSQSFSTRDAVAQVSAETGYPRRELYNLVNKIEKDT